VTVYRRNPLLMTVMGANPGHRTRKGAERAIDAAISNSWSRLMSGVQVPILDIPRIFRDIKLEMAAGVPLDQAVLSVGARYRVNPNPGIGEAIVGGMAGALASRAFQANPAGGPSFVVIDSETGRVAYTKKATGVGSEAIASCARVARRLADQHQRPYIVFLHLGAVYVGSQMNVGMVRAMGITEEVFPGGGRTFGNPARRHLPARHNPAIRTEWDRLTGRRRLAVLEFAGVPYEQARRLAGRAWGTLPPSIQDEVAKGWQENPLTKREAADALRRAKASAAYARKHRDKYYAGRAEGMTDVVYRHGPQKSRHIAGKISWRAAVAPHARPNPGSGRRKMTLTVEKFAQWVKSKRDPAMWRAFLAKFKGYEKWTHGARARKVTVEWVDTPGVNGLWITYDGGRQPESTYVMPKGSRRKGAWKHEWDTMPQIKHDPEAGIVLTKLRGRSKITDYYYR
jgi:hypothetical protein